MSDFWARRKAAVEAEHRAEEDAVAQDIAAEQEQVLAERPDEELLAEHGLRAPEELDSPEEVQDFLKAALPQRLKTRALRRLWRLNPVLANLDGLVDYGEDYTDAATVVENLQTIYQVGKGMFDKAEEAARSAEEQAELAAKKAEEAALEEAEMAQDLQDAEDAADQAPETTPERVAAQTPHHIADSAEPEAPEMPLASRRMRFHFDSSQDQGLT